jgi:two-component system chemotaxis sensor kinase CheA
MQLSPEDDELLAEFLAESREGLAAVEGHLVTLEHDPEARSALEATFRCLHTIKGSAGYFGLNSIKSVAHSLENLLDRMRSGTLTADATISETLLDGVDLLSTLMEDTESKRGDNFREGEVLALVESVGSLLSGESEQVQASAFHQTIARLRESAGQNAALDGHLEQLVKLAAKLVPTSGKAESDEKVETLSVSPSATNAPAPAPPPAETKRSANAANPTNAPPKRGQNTDEDGANKNQEASAGSDKTMRVPERRVDDFLSYVGSLVRLRQVITSVEKRMNSSVADLALLSEVRTMASSFIKVSEELQRSVMSLRLVPVSTILRKVPRLVRDVAVARGKDIQVKLEGESLEIDKSLVEVLEGPIIHMVRNAADHGIEVPAVRQSAGKKTMGTIIVRVVETSDEMRVEIIDDGGGINREKLKTKAVATGLIGADENLSDDDIVALLFAPGISTADEITDISGRGVGMDVVRRNVEERGGAIKVITALGKGSTFSVSLPKTVATSITPAITVRSADLAFAVPLISISEIVLLDPPPSHEVERTPDGQVLRLRDEVFPLISLRRELDQKECDDPECGRTVILFDTEAGTIGVRVDQVFDSLDVVVQEISFLARRGLTFSEACVLGDGSIALILNAEIIASRVPRATSSAQNSKSSSETRKQTTSNTRVTDRYLVYELSNGHRQVIPMRAVVRLETIEDAELERVGSRYCVQYRGQLLHVAIPNGHTLSRNCAMAMVVLALGDQIMGLFVEAILDVVEDVVMDRRPIGRNGVAAALMIGDVTYEELDLDALRTTTLRGLEFAA